MLWIRNYPPLPPPDFLQKNIQFLKVMAIILVNVEVDAEVIEEVVVLAEAAAVVVVVVEEVVLALRKK